MSIAVTPSDKIELITHMPPAKQAEAMEVQLQQLIERIETLPEGNLLRIAVKTLHYSLRELTREPVHESAVKLTALSIYATFAAFSGITTAAGVVLLTNAEYSQTLAADDDVRVGFANSITNAGALCACLTDLPFITYFLYLLVLKSGKTDALHELMDEHYFACVCEQLGLPPEAHERLYQSHIQTLKELGIDKFYLRPDPLSPTGVVHTQLAPILREIDQELDRGIPLADLAKKSYEVFMNAPWTAKLEKAGISAVSLFFIALSSFLVLENGILVVNTPVDQLFSRNETLQTNEAFNLTQAGCLYSTVTAFGVACWFLYLAFLKTPLRIRQRERIESCFAAHLPTVSQQSVPMQVEFERIKLVKLKKTK